MMEVFSKIEEFDRSKEYWSNYVKGGLKANLITTAEEKQSVVPLHTNY